MIYVTTAAAYPLGPVYGIRVSINQTTIGTVTIADAGGTKAVIAATSGIVEKEYWGFNGAVTVTNASAENITVSIINTPR